MGLGRDVNGNVINKDGNHYDFDYGNRLHGATYNGATLETYWYDGYGRRVISTAPTGTIQSIYSLGGQLLYQNNARTGKRINYYYLAGSLVNEVEYDVSSSTYANRFQHTDALGSPVVVTNGPHAILERNEYEPYGMVLKGGYADRPGFTGHVADAQTGMNYMQQRYYDPMLGIFDSVDPVTAYQKPLTNFNRYAYANNNPYKFTDPDGRQARSVGMPEPGMEQRVPIPVLQRLKAAVDAAVPKTAYASATGPSAKAGGPAISATAEAGKVTVAISVRGASANASAGSARIDTVAGSASTSGQPSSGMAVGVGAELYSVSAGVSNAMDAKVIDAIPMTKINLPLISVGFGTDSKGNYAIQAEGGMKGQASYERPRQED